MTCNELMFQYFGSHSNKVRNPFVLQSSQGLTWADIALTWLSFHSFVEFVHAFTWM